MFSSIFGYGGDTKAAEETAAEARSTEATLEAKPEEAKSEAKLEAAETTPASEKPVEVASASPEVSTPATETVTAAPAAEATAVAATLATEAAPGSETASPAPAAAPVEESTPAPAPPAEVKVEEPGGSSPAETTSEQPIAEPATVVPEPSGPASSEAAETKVEPAAVAQEVAEVTAEATPAGAKEETDAKEGGAKKTDAPKERGVKVHVKNLSVEMTTEQLRALFEPYGNVLNALAKTNREDQTCRGFGFVVFSSAEEAQKAIAGANGKEVHGKALEVQLVERRAEQTDDKKGKGAKGKGKDGRGSKGKGKGKEGGRDDRGGKGKGKGQNHGKGQGKGTDSAVPAAAAVAATGYAQQVASATQLQAMNPMSYMPYAYSPQMYQQAASMYMPQMYGMQYPMGGMCGWDAYRYAQMQAMLPQMIAAQSAAEAAAATPAQQSAPAAGAADESAPERREQPAARGQPTGKGRKEDPKVEQKQLPPSLEGKTLEGRLKSISSKNGYGFLENAEVNTVYGRDVFVILELLPQEAKIDDRFAFTVGLNAKYHPKVDTIISPLPASS